MCIHIGGTGVTGCTASHNEAVTPSSGYGNVVGAGMTQLSFCFCRKHFENMKKNSRNWSETWSMPLTLFIFFFFPPPVTRGCICLHLFCLCLSVFSFMPGCLPTWALLRACFSLWKECICLPACLNQALFLGGKKNNCFWITGRHFFLKIVLLVDNGWGSLRWMQGCAMYFSLLQPVQFF